MLTQDALLQAIPHALTGVELSGLGQKQTGKVRDIYRQNGRRILITTDRVSAFDRVLGTIPFKGQVLNQLSAWWFEQTTDIVANHMEALPDPNVMVVVEAEPLPIEVIVRGYLTGVTSTSIWTLYQQGERRPYGIELPDGMHKDDPLPHPIITPTTKATDGAHDERLTRDEILAKGIVESSLYEQVEAAALALFARGQAVAARTGLVLVDTKYEFGTVDGVLVLIDEIHTPDSSRYWVTGGLEPENLDKEYLRKWLVSQGYQGEGVPPALPPELKTEVAARYIEAYERLTDQLFIAGEQPVSNRIAHAMQQWMER